MTEEPNDETLFHHYVEHGDDSSFDHLFERYSGKVLRYMNHRVSDPQDARELVQKTFLLIHRSRNEFRGDSKFATWLWAIAVNLRRDYLRKFLFRAKFRSVDSDAIASAEPEDFEKREQIRRLQSCVRGLPEGSRSVIELHWYEDLAFLDVATILGISESAAKTRAHRAYEALRHCMEKS